MLIQQQGPSGPKQLFSAPHGPVAEREAEETETFHESKRKFQCWTEEEWPGLKPRAVFPGCKHGKPGSLEPLARAGRSWGQFPLRGASGEAEAVTKSFRRHLWCTWPGAFTRNRGWTRNASAAARKPAPTPQRVWAWDQGTGLPEAPGSEVSSSRPLGWEAAPFL